MRLRAEKSLMERTQDAVVALIRDQGLKTGDQLPTEVALSASLKVGRSTLREAVGNLVASGVLQRAQGRGTFVRRAPIVLNQALDNLNSVTEIIRATGARPSTRRLVVEQVEASEAIAARLGVPIGSPCKRIERVREADSTVAVFSVDVLSDQIAQQVDVGLDGSLFEILRSSGHPVAYTRTEISPVLLTPDLLPELAKPTLFLLLEEVYFDEKGDAVCYGNDYYNAEVVRFDLIRTRKSRSGDST